MTHSTCLPWSRTPAAKIALAGVFMDLALEHGGGDKMSTEAAALMYLLEGIEEIR